MESIVAVLRSESLTQGAMVPEFEHALCRYTGAKHCTVTCNATSALHITLLAIGVKGGDTVWTSPISFVASANCALYCGASIDFVDIDPITRNICASRFAEKLKIAKHENKLPKALIVVHLSGLPCDLEPISKLCKKHNVKLLEDASHALGATYNEQPIGSCKWSDFSIFSFHPVKMITTGEGGAVTTNDPTHKARLDLLRSHGITKSHVQHESKNQPDFYYEQQLLGFNYRMTDIQAALGISQLKRLNGFIEARQRLVNCYNENLRDAPLQLPAQPAGRRSSWHLYIINVSLDPEARQNEALRNQLYVRLKEAGILCNLHYLPIHQQPYYRRLGFKPGDFPNAERYAMTALTIPLHGHLSPEDCENIAVKIKTYLN